jgi:TPR repeat protein
MARSQAVSQESHEPSPEVSPGESAQLYRQGLAYLYDAGTGHDCDSALVSLRKAADLGNVQASSQLGALYATGHCVPVDRVRAYHWFTRAADATHGRNLLIERNRQILWNEMTSKEQAAAGVPRFPSR